MVEVAAADAGVMVERSGRKGSRWHLHRRGERRWRRRRQARRRGFDGDGRIESSGIESDSGDGFGCGGKRVAEATRVAMMSPEAGVTVVVEKASGEAGIEMTLEPVHLRTGTCGCVSE